MKNQDLQEEFIRLRAQGISYDNISQSISVSKPTLLKWGQTYADQVAKAISCNVENILEQYRLIKIARTEAFAQSLRKALDELSRRDFSSLSTKDLLSISLLLENKLREEVNSIQAVRQGDSFPRDLFDESLPISY